MSEQDLDKREINILVCPNCNDFVIISKKNCGIFRHGIIKKNGKQIPSHASKQQCDNYVRENKIYGCGKPFRIIIVDSKFTTEICDYI